MKFVIIYKLVCNDLSVKDLYVGHTTDFTNRKKSHKDRSIYPNNPKYNLKVYKIMRENGGWDNWSMIEIEKYPCNDENEARSRERYWYEELQATMNTQCPTLDLEKKKLNGSMSCKKYYELHKDDLIKYHREYYELYKDKLLEDKKEYYKRNIDVIRERNKNNYEKNKDKLLEYKKDNYKKRKDYLLEKHKCGCGGCFSTANRSAHFKTKKHLKYIQENELD